MYASAVAETPPVISRVTPRSQVINATASRSVLVLGMGKWHNDVRSIDEKSIVVVKKTCR